MFILSDGDFFDEDGADGIISGVNNNCQYDTGLSQNKHFSLWHFEINPVILIFLGYSNSNFSKSGLSVIFDI